MSKERADIANKEFNEAMKLLNTNNLWKFDPFDWVILSSKGIDNSILTSFRTLQKKNNSISDTFKIIHQKVCPTQAKSNPYANRSKLSLLEKRAVVDEAPYDMSSAPKVLRKREPPRLPPPNYGHHSFLPPI